LIDSFVFLIIEYTWFVQRSKLFGVDYFCILWCFDSKCAPQIFDRFPWVRNSFIVWRKKWHWYV